MLRGHATARVDDKGRLKIPFEFAQRFLEMCGEGRRVYITSRDGSTVLVYPLPYWEQIEAKLAALPSSDAAVEALIKATSYWGRETQVDGQGRILLHGLLKNSARIDGDASVFGKQRLIEIANHEMFRQRPPTVSREDLQRLSDLGV